MTRTTGERATPPAIKGRPFAERRTIIRARTANAMAAINHTDTLLPDGLLPDA